jgi:hypothetical protein
MEGDMIIKISIDSLTGSTLSFNYYLYEGTPSPLHVDWGDDIVNTDNTDTTHTYTTTGKYTVTITGHVDAIRFNLSTEYPIIDEIVQWGLGATNYIDAFEGSNLTKFPSDMLVATNTSHMFVNSFRLNTLPTIDTSNVTDMSHMFAGCKQFNQSIGSYSIKSIPSGHPPSTPDDKDNLSECLKDILYSTAISTDNYSDTLIEWANQYDIPSYIDLGKVSNGNTNVRCTYNSNAEESRKKLTNDYFWKIDDGGLTPNTSLLSQDMILTIDLTELITQYTVDITISGENIMIDWEDGPINSDTNHSYTFGKKYTITISGTATQFNYSSSLNAVLTGIDQWGLGITDYSGAFQKCNNNISLPLTTLTGVTNTSYMFNESHIFNQPIFIDTSSVKNMSYMFNECYDFNHLVTLNTSSATNMSHMFAGCSSFNKPIVFDTPFVTKMDYMFAQCYDFNQSVTLNTSSVTNMSHMFTGCSSFNKPIVFDTPFVTRMDYMFAQCLVFNQSVTLNTSSVTDMSYMFYKTLVNQSFDSFSIAHIISGDDTTLCNGLLSMFNFTNLTIDTYSDTLIGWANQDTIPSYVNLGTVSDSLGVRISHNIQSHVSYLKLVHKYKWNIYDGELVADTSSNIVPLNTVVNLNNYPTLKTYALLSQSEISTLSTIIKNGFYGSRISSYIGEFIGRNDSVNINKAMRELLQLIQTIHTARHHGKPFDNLGIITAPRTLYPNINYNSATSIVFEGVPIILDARGNSKALFFIKAHSELIFNNIPSITLINGALSNNIFWLAETSISFTGTLPPSIPGIFIAGSSIIFGDSTAIRRSILQNIGVHINGHLFSLGNIVLSGVVSVDASYQETIICYLKGTSILTNQGYVPIENIRAGHGVVTKGKIRENKIVNKNAPLTIEPVMWISKFKVFDLTTKSRPICVSKDAFGKNYPFKNLYVSPSHRFLIHGNMVIASELINGTTIFQDVTCDDVVYYHLECEEHSAIIANGVLTETCLSTNKDMFEHSIKYYRKMNSPKMNFKKISLGMY